MTGGAAAEARMTNRYKLSKQADVLMLFYLCFAEELKLAALFDRLGLAEDNVLRFHS